MDKLQLFRSQEEEGSGKRWLHMFEPYRRLKDEDPIIPFGEGPIISKWGAISRASRTGYQTTDPIQATASQGSASTTSVNFRGESASVLDSKILTEWKYVITFTEAMNLGSEEAYY